MARKLTTFTVVGRMAFPTDMLRYDQCWPVSSEDAAKIDSANDRRGIIATYRVTLKTVSVSGPTVRRWASFSWSVDPTSVKVEKLQ